MTCDVGEGLHTRRRRLVRVQLGVERLDEGAFTARVEAPREGEHAGPDDASGLDRVSSRGGWARFQFITHAPISMYQRAWLLDVSPRSLRRLRRPCFMMESVSERTPRPRTHRRGRPSRAGAAPPHCSSPRGERPPQCVRTSSSSGSSWESWSSSLPMSCAWRQFDHRDSRRLVCSSSEHGARDTPLALSLSGTHLKPSAVLWTCREVVDRRVRETSDATSATSDAHVPALMKGGERRTC